MPPLKLTQDTQRLYQLNLNHLPFLAALLQHSSITRAGLALELSQPAASRIMAQLRKTLGDPLLVRTRQGYQVTAYLRSLEPAIVQALAAAQQVFRPKNFEPLVDKRQFRVATTDYGLISVLQPLLVTLHEQAPYVSMQALAWNEHTLSQLEQGEVDLLLIADDLLIADCYRHYLFEEEYALVMANHHPLASYSHLEQVLPQLYAYPHIIPSYPTAQGFAEDGVLQQLAHGEPPARIVVAYFQAALWLLPDSPYIAALPLRIVQPLQQRLSLKVWPLAQRIPTFKYYLMWHQRSQHDPFQRWIREWLVKCIAVNP